jgi:hypothetical protein
MTDQDYLKWIAEHLAELQVGTPTDRVKIVWYDDDGYSHNTMGERGVNYLEGLKFVINKAIRGGST